MREGSGEAFSGCPHPECTGTASPLFTFDTTNPFGRTMTHMFGALAWFEHVMIRERASAGLAA
jgi:hypothetical protein